MKKLIVAILFIYIFTNNLNSQWIFQYSTGTFTTVNSINFINENTGYVVGVGPSLRNYGFINKTTNSGVNWTNLTLPAIMNTRLYDVSFINPNIGFVSGFSNKIFKTTDGGFNWSYTTAPWINVTQTYNAIQFFNEQTGYIGGRYGMRAKTTNSGLTWITLDTAYTEISSLFFLNVNTGYTGDTYSGIYKTTNGGQSWSYQYLTDTVWNSGYVFNKIDFADYNTGYAVGANVYNGALFKTTNGGTFWKSILVLHDIPLFSLEVIGISTVYVGGEMNLIYKSTNAGLNWFSQKLPTQSIQTYSIFFVNENIGFASDASEIMKTTNGGSVFVNELSSEIPETFSLSQNYPNPFNPTTKIKFEIPLSKGRRASEEVGLKGVVSLKVFNILGEEITTLANGKLQPGTYEATFDGSNLSSGVYFYQLSAGDFIQTKRMVLIK